MCCNQPQYILTWICHNYATGPCRNPGVISHQRLITEIEIVVPTKVICFATRGCNPSLRDHLTSINERKIHVMRDKPSNDIHVLNCKMSPDLGGHHPKQTDLKNLNHRARNIGLVRPFAEQPPIAVLMSLAKVLDNEQSFMPFFSFRILAARCTIQRSASSRSCTTAVRRRGMIIQFYTAGRPPANRFMMGMRRASGSTRI